VADLARCIEHRGDRLRYGVQTAVLAPVDHLALPGPAGAERCPELFEVGRRHQARLDQLARGFADQFVQGIAGDAGVAGIGPDDQTLGVGDQHPIAGRFQGRAQQLHPTLDAVLFADILLDRDVVADPAGLVAQRGDGLIFVVPGTILALVDHVATPGPAAGYGLPQVLIESAVVVAGTHQRAGVAPDRFLRRVAGQGAERRVDPDDAALGVGDHDAVRGRFQGRALQAHAPLVAALRGDLAHHPQGMPGQTRNGRDLGVVPVLRAIELDGVLHPLWPGTSKCFAHDPAHAGAIVWSQKVVDRHAGYVFDARGQTRIAGRQVALVAAFGVDHQDQLLHCTEQGAQAGEHPGQLIVGPWWRAGILIARSAHGLWPLASCCCS